MCNLYTQTRSPDEIAQLFSALQMPISFPEGIPNLQPREIAITDSAPIVRSSGRNGAFELVVRRWSWPGNGARPVYNFRSEGREFPNGRCLVIADGFFEFTAASTPGAKRKDRWLFTAKEGEMLGIAGLTRRIGGADEAFTMLTTTPGPDVAPYHGRQIVIVPRASWHSWLDYSKTAAEIIGPAMEGSLEVRAAPR